MGLCVIHNIDGELLFELYCMGNTVKKTVEEAVRQGVSLERAYLANKNLAYASLSGANFALADLEGIDFTGADLSFATLPWCIRGDRNLSQANLEGVVYE